MAELKPIDAVADVAALADLGLDALDLFRKVEKVLKERSDESLPEDLLIAESQRFELWAANMGLFVPGHGSLDYRVREAEKLAQTLRRFMRDLNTLLEEVVEMCSDSKQEDASGMDTSGGGGSATQAPEAEAGNEDEDEETWDKDVLVDSVRDPINRLFKISTKIRNPSTRLGSSRAANYQQEDEETGVDLLQAMKKFDLDYVRSMFLEYRKNKARRESHPAQPAGVPPGENDDEVWEPIRTVLLQVNERGSTGASSYLIERIAQANVRRRQQFAYWAKHRNKLEKHTKAFQAQKGRLPIAEGHRDGQLGLEPDPGTLPSISSATRVDLAKLEISSDTRSTWTLSEYAPSTRQAGEAVDFPPAPKVSRKTETDKFFECPYCFFLCPKDILAEKAWKAHLIHDLRPYICTYEDCRNPTQLYDSRRDWVQHENSVHRRIWRCLEHPTKVFESLDTYQRHLQEEHAGSINGEASLARIIQASESVADVAKWTCLICTVELDAGRSMEGHIALHLERFARFSLPRSAVHDDDGSNADSGKANRVDEEGSRDDDFEGDLEIHSNANPSESQSTGRPPKVGNSSPPHGTEATGDKFGRSEASEDRDESSSSESGQSHREVEQPTEDESTFDGVELGEWFTDFEKYEKAEQHYRESLELSEKTRGADHPDTLQSMRRLELLFRGQLKFKEAEQIVRRMLELEEKSLGHEHPDTWDYMHQLAYLLYEQKEYVEAEQRHRRVLALRENEWGREDPRTLYSMSNLTTTLLCLDRMEEAEQLGRETMESRKKVLGPSHPATLTSISNLAGAMLDLNRLEEAEQLGREAMESRKKVLGPSHPDTLASMFNLTAVLSSLDRLEETEQLGREVMEIRRKLLGPFHPDTLASIESMANFMWKQNRLEETEKLEVEVLEAKRQNLGSYNRDTLAAMGNLAYTWHSQGRIAEAIALMGECLQLRRQVQGPEHEDTLSDAEDLEKWRAELAQRGI